MKEHYGNFYRIFIHKFTWIHEQNERKLAQEQAENFIYINLLQKAFF